MAAARYLHVDVFAASRGGGNHLGVVVDGAGWSDAAMQRFARWTQLVETTFLLPPTVSGASYRVRIFSPVREVPFASHPSIGSAHALLETGFVPPADGVLHQECSVGVLPIRVEGTGLARSLFLRPPTARILRAGPGADPLLAAALRGIHPGILPPALVTGGRTWWVAEVANEAEVRAWRPDRAALAALARGSDSIGLCVFARCPSDAPALVVRAFPAGLGIAEDPASGAANGLLAAYLVKAGPAGAYARGYTVSQGREMGHDAELQVRFVDGAVWVGGRTNTIIRGTVDWDVAEA